MSESGSDIDNQLTIEDETYGQAQFGHCGSWNQDQEKAEEHLRAGEDEILDPFCNPNKPVQISFHDVTSAAFLIKGGVVYTPCTRSHLSNLLGMEVYLKKEFMQYTGSFKDRGARYSLLKLSDEQKKRGVISASSGNHAQGLCYQAWSLGIPATVVMPVAASIMKVEKCRKMQARVLIAGNHIGEARSHALKIGKNEGLVYINGYDHPDILAGQGTVGLEILEQVHEPDAVVVPVGGGGLIAGVAVAIKALHPATKVIGVESEMTPSLTSALASGKPVNTTYQSTLADGLAVPLIGFNSFATIVPLLDKMITVKEEWIALGMLKVMELEKAVIEGAAGCCLAAAFSGQLDEFKGKKIVLILSGGNIDSIVLGRCLERGLASEGRLVRFTVRVNDRPGGIGELCQLVGSLGISIKDIMHERAWLKDIYSVEVRVVCETRDWSHSLELRAKLMEKYSCINFIDVPLALSTQDKSMILKCE